MHIRCPHCHSPVEVVDADPLTDVTCPSCGSNFSLISGETTSYAPGDVRTIEHFQLLESVGAGRFGTVWKARDTKLDRTVAVKIPRRGQIEGPEAEMFVREARAAAQVKHPGVVAVHEVGREDGTLYIVSDFIDGCSLKDLLSGRQLTPREAAELCAKIAEALQVAHEAGVVHRDLKPGNVMMDMAGQPRLTDFGLAKREAGEITMTVDGQMLGTPAYMSPEQARGEAHMADRRSDVYSLGVILFELLTGETPFRGNQRMMVVQILQDDPPSPRKLQTRIPRDLETICLKCLEKPPGKRYQTAAELAAELGRFLRGEPIVARPVGRPARLWRWCKRQPVVAGLTAAVALALVAGTIISWAFAVKAYGERDRAEAGEKLAKTEKEKAEAAADGERKALEKETITLADAHTSLGLSAAEQNNPYEAVLWFASAVNLARTDLQRELANRTRFATWAHRLAYPVAALPHSLPYSGLYVKRFVFHPSDDWLLAFSGNGDGGYALYDVRTGRLAELPIPTRGRGCAEWSPDGKLLALGDAQGRVDIYGFPECCLLHALKHPGAVRALRFSDDGRYLAIGSDVVRVWSTAKKDLLAGELHHPQAVVGIDFDPAGQRLVTSCLDNMARVFSIDGERIETRPLFPPTEHAVRSNLIHASSFCATFVANSGLLVSKDHIELRWLDAKTGAEIRRLNLPGTYLTMVRVSPDRRSYVTCRRQGRACQLWDATRHDSTGITLAQPQGTLDAAFNLDGKSVITAAFDGTVRFWSAFGGQPLDAPLPRQNVVARVACSPSGKFLATLQWDGLFRIWRLPPTAKTLHVSGSPLSGQFRLVLSTDGRFSLASGAWPSRGLPNVQVYETASGRAVGLPLTAGAGINGAEFSPDGRRVMAAIAPSSSGSGGIVVWDWRSGEQCFPTIPTPSEPADVAYSPCGDYAVAVCVKGEVLVIDASTGQVRKSANDRAFMGYSSAGNPPKRWVVFSPDGRRFATLGVGSIVRLWTATGELACSVVHQSVVKQAAFSPKGDYLATASDDSSARVCDVASGKVLAILRHPDALYAVQFSPDQRQLLTACRDGMARLWDWEKGRLACPGFEHKDAVCDARFLPHQPWIVTLGKDSAVRGWDPRTGMAIVPPLGLSPGSAGSLHDLMIACDGKLIAVPGSGTFEVIDVADTGLVGRQDFDLVGLQSVGELYAGRQIVGSGSVKLTADEWLQRWESLPANYPGSAPVERGGAPAGYGGFTQVVRRISAARIDAEARSSATAARRLALMGKPLQVEGTALDGKPFDWNAYRGKVTLIEFWTTYSPESQTLLAATRGLYDLYHDVGLEVVGVSLDEHRLLLGRFLAEEEIPWTTLHTDAVGLNHPLAVRCGVCEVPTWLLVDRDGKVVSQADRTDDLAARLRETLGPPFRGPLTHLDLQPQANWTLNENYLRENPPGSDLASLPRGEGDFSGVKFNIGASALRLGGAKYPTQPKRIENIPVNALATKLCFLHATGWGSNERAAIGEYVVHYVDGGVRSIPILYGEDLRNWYRRQDGRPASRATVAWRGRTASDVDIQLFLSVWKNPRPETKIASLDYVSAMTEAAPFCVAITAEGPVASKSAQHVDR